MDYCNSKLQLKLSCNSEIVFNIIQETENDMINGGQFLIS